MPRPVNLETRLLRNIKLKPKTPGRPISEWYIRTRTVEPLDESFLSGRSYRMSIAPNGCSLVIKLREHVFSNNASRVIGTVSVATPKRYSAGWVDKIAETFTDNCRCNGVLSGNLPSYETLRRLVATRVEYYLNGGSAQLKNRDN